MDYWRGIMDWPIDPDWTCETCGENIGLEWGFVHGQCRCNRCHTQYTMRAHDEKHTIQTRPLCNLKDDYKEPAKAAWGKWHKPIEDVTDNEWDTLLAPVEEKKKE